MATPQMIMVKISLRELIGLTGSAQRAAISTNVS
jgi:hypothetical protein